MYNETQVQQLVSLWQKRLGLDHWTILVKFEISEHSNNDDDDREVFARIYTHSKYDDATLEIASWVTDSSVKPPDVLEADMLTDELTERKLVHELLHCWTRDLVDVPLEHLDGFLHRDVYNLFYDNLNRLNERFVDNLARSLVANWAD
jgi:hypothetical protein